MYWFETQMIQTFAKDIAGEDLLELVDIYHIRESDPDRRYYESEFVMDFTTMFLNNRNKILRDRHDSFLDLSSSEAQQIIREFWKEVLYSQLTRTNQDLG